MAKFKVGDIVKSNSNRVGVITEVYDNEQYAVRFAGERMPVSMDGYKLKAYNACRNAKFSYNQWVLVYDPTIMAGTALGRAFEVPRKGRVMRVLADGTYIVDFPHLGAWKVHESKISANACRNAVVRNALAWCGKPVCNGYMTLRTKGGGTAKVYDGDQVEYKGRLLAVKAVGSPQTDKITLDDNGSKVVVKGDDGQLFAVNAE